MNVVLFHANCPDGWCAAFIAAKALEITDKSLLIPCNYAEPDLELKLTSAVARLNDGGGICYMLDFSLPRERLIQFHAETGQRLVVLDHHATAEADLKDLGDWVMFDMARCGAMMTLDYFAPKVADPGQFKAYFNTVAEYTQDRDLWHWKLFKSRQVSAWIATRERDLATWHEVPEMLNHQMDSVLLAGDAILNFQGQLVRHAVEKSELRYYVDEDLKEYKVRTTGGYNLQSEICEALYTADPECDVALLYSLQPDMRSINISLRSKNGTDVSKIATRFGGGGHKAAAGCQIFIEKFPLIFRQTSKDSPAVVPAAEISKAPEPVTKETGPAEVSKGPKNG